MGDNFHVTFEALRERRCNMLGRKNSPSDRRKAQMETLKGPVLPFSNNNLSIQSGASRNRGRTQKPSVSCIDFTNHVGDKKLNLV